MVEWRSRGYVQDSDDGDSISENEFFDAEEQALSNEAARPAVDVPESHIGPDRDGSARSDLLDEYEHIDELQLEHQHYDRCPLGSAELPRVPTSAKKESKNVFDVPSSLTEEHAQQRPTSPSSSSSSSSSALSDVPSFAVSRSPSPQLSASIRQPVVVITPRVSSPEPQHGHRADGRRTFRQRNPIQLHPYLLENETYRQSLRARGLRPVQVARDEVRRETEAQVDTQWRDGSGAGSDSEDGLSFSSPQPVEGSQQPQTSSPTLYDDAELPSLDDLLTRRVENGAQMGFKRIKTSHQLARTSSDRNAPLDGLAMGARRAESLQYSHTQDLPSPASETGPHHHKLRRVRRKKFKHLPAYEPAHLLTPGPSSDIEKARIETIAIDSESDDEPRTASRSTVRDISAHLIRSVSPESSDAGSQEKKQIRNATKRIKGVLPASWLRIDQQAQHRKPTMSVQAAHHTSPRKRTGDRGVARRVSSLKQTTPQSDRMIHEESFLQRVGDESASDVETAHTHKLESSSSPLLGHRLPMETQDLEVDDWVDPMLPTASRQPRIKAKRRKQMGLKDAFPRSHSGKNNEVVRDTRGTGVISQPRASRGSKAGIRHRASRIRCSIIDVIDRTASAPDFLRVATRRAQKRTDKGRHSPTSKQISFHNSQDTRSVQQDLSDWRHGHVRSQLDHRNDSVARPHRLPLSEQSGNQQTRFPSPIKLPTYGPTATDHPPASRSASDSTITYQRARKKQIRQQRLNLAPLDRPSTYPAEVARISKVNAPVKATKAASKLKDVLFAHPGQLEDFDQNRESSHHVETFSKNLNHLDNEFHYRGRYQQRTANPLLQRYLDPTADADQDRDGEPPYEHLRLVSRSTEARPRRHRRKTRPQALSVRENGIAALDYENHFPSEMISSEPCIDDNKSLTGLSNHNVIYTTDFSARPLPSGLFFHQSTFLGSCEFQAALATGSRDLGRPCSPTTITHRGTTYRWSSWNEEVLSQLRSVLLDDGAPFRQDGAASDALSRSIVHYFAKSLSFFDALDRPRCIQQLNALVGTLLDDCSLNQRDQAENAQQPFDINGRLSNATYGVVLAFQIRQIAHHVDVAPETTQMSDHLFMTALRSFSTLLLKSGVQQMDAKLIAIRQTPGDVYCVQDDHPALEGPVVVHHILRIAYQSGPQLWDLIGETLLAGKPCDYTSISSFEAAWSIVYSVLPILHVDSLGLVADHRHHILHAGWTVIKPLLSRLCELYAATNKGHAPHINSYLRASLSRCFILADSWGWKHGEVVLGCMFDFFAQRGFAYLEREDCRGSPRFLEMLDESESMYLEPSDRSFDIVLKLLALVLRKIRSTSPGKKAKNVIWRFVPNHGRRHAKETQLLEDDLNALRNQHNLLCVLYWTSPPTFRLATSHLRNLVDVRTSHSEVIRINIRSWANLVRYQLSTGEDPSTLDQFSRWYNSILHDLIGLHRHARIEAEAAFAAAAKSAGGPTLSHDVLESVIINNERQVEGLLTMMLASLGSLMTECKMPTMAQHLFEQCDVGACLSLFDPKRPRFFKQVALALDACRTYFRLRAPLETEQDQAENNDDSQDFGDWSDVEALAEVGSDALQKIDVVLKMVQSLISNCLGAEAFFDEALLTKVTDVWLAACQCLVRLKQRSWNYFLDPQSNGSWSQFRGTDQTRMYGIYWVTQAIKADASAYHENEACLVAIWMKSLVERESVLKFQHLLTSSLLNEGGNLGLLNNLPFLKMLGASSYDISLQELRDRRLGIISSILANIRSSVEASDVDLADTTGRLRQDYAMILRALMDEMKRIFQDMQQTSSLRGSYVDFVQQVVEYLQQYTADILPIDKFFTDSGAFPLPAKDPTYVTGRLKSFIPSLADERSQKKLAIFLQAVCERAANDNQQAYLVEQLAASIGGHWEKADDDQLSLRRILLEIFFPVYIERTFSDDCGWILALPLIEASGIIFEDLVLAFDAVDLKVTFSIVRTLSSLLRPLRKAVAHVAADTRLLYQPHVSSVLSVIFRATASMLPLADYIERLMTTDEATTGHLLYVHAFGTMLLRMSQDQESTVDLSPFAEPEPLTDVDNVYRTVTTFCERELSETLSKNWTRHGHEYFVMRGRERREVTVDLATPEKELEDLVDEVEAFMAVWNRMPAMRELSEEFADA